LLQSNHPSNNALLQSNHPSNNALLQSNHLLVANELSHRQAKYDEYRKYVERDNGEVMKRVRGEISRYQKARSKIFTSNNIGPIMENVISAFLSCNRDVEYSPEMVHLCGPFMHVLPHEHDIYYCFSALMFRKGINSNGKKTNC
jgi:hypothetical protein